MRMKATDWLLGRPLATHEAAEQTIGPASGVAVLGLDGLSSAAYGPEAALTILLPLGSLGLLYIGPITLLIVALLIVLYLSYRQTISAYPDGGGSYTVAKENLGAGPGLAAGAALLIDYILNVAVGISAGIGALVSALPFLQPHILSLCLLTLCLLAIVNLRGTRESGVALGIPTLLFVVSLFAVVAVGIAKTVLAGGHPHAIVAPPPPPAVALAPVSLWLLLRAFASGCTAMTGVEAVSNGVTVFKRPAVRNAQRTLTAIVVILAILLGSVAYLAHAYGVVATDPSSPGYQSVLSMITAAIIGRGVCYYITLGAVIAVLALSANTSFADFPRLCRLLAQDNYLPHAFANRGRRLVYTAGIVMLTLSAGALLVAFGGVTDRLIPLFAIGAFLAFTLSQAGMVIHWRRAAAAATATATDVKNAEGAGKGVALTINAAGCVTTAIALGIILAAKFWEGAWITVLLLPALVGWFLGVHRHYAMVGRKAAYAGPLQTRTLQPPTVIVLLKSWDRITERALRFGMSISPNVIAVHVAAAHTPHERREPERDIEALRDFWEASIVAPAQNAGLPIPHLEILESPYRRLFTPLLDFIERLRCDNPERMIAVIIPEMVETHWYQYPLHNQRATALKAALLLRGGRQLAVINVPWYLSHLADETGERQ